MLAALAALQLRPIFRRQDGTVRKSRGLRTILAGRRVRSHPRLGDRPMLWKELHTSRARGFARLVGWLLTLIAGGFLSYYAVKFGGDAFLEVRRFGFGATGLEHRRGAVGFTSSFSWSCPCSTWWGS